MAGRVADRGGEGGGNGGGSSTVAMPLGDVSGGSN